MGETLCAWSAASGSIDVPWRFQGRILESASAGTDLYDFGARSYDPSLGIFTSFDSSWFARAGRASRLARAGAAGLAVFGSVAPLGFGLGAEPVASTVMAVLALLLIAFPPRPRQD